MAISQFGPYRDVPTQIKNEGQKISINLQKTSSTTARISWNIPEPFLGCENADEQAYNGIVVTIDTTPASSTKLPTDGTKYTADPTADPDLHAGDKIGSSLVVGAFYDDKTTTFVDVTDLDPDTTYFVTGNAVDNVLQYHIEGVHSYSLKLGGEVVEPTSGFQIIELITQNQDFFDGCFEGATTDELTGLLPGQTYSFVLGIDGVLVNVPVGGVAVGTSFTKAFLGQQEQIDIDAADAATYGELVTAIQKQIDLIDDPTQSAGAPNVGSFFVDTSTAPYTLYQWDGSTHVQLTLVVDSTTPLPPAFPVTNGDYWFNTSTDELNKFTGTWTVQTNVIKSENDPTDLPCPSWWFNGSDGFEWSGTVWIPKTTIVQATNPATVSISCPYYWFDEDTGVFNEWDDEHDCWVAVTRVIAFPTDPQSPTVGDLWFDETNKALFQWSGSAWAQVTVVIGTTQPSAPSTGLYWFNPTTEILTQFDGTNFVEKDVILFPDDPTSPTGGDLWWNTTTDDLYIWDATTLSWDLTGPFVISSDDPSETPTFTIGTLWFNTTNSTLWRWDGSQFVQVQYINYPTDPTAPNVGDYWYQYDSTDSTVANFFIWSGTAWTSISTIVLATDPLAAGTYWYNAVTNQLFLFNGAAFGPALSFSTLPFTPSVGEQYFDTTVDQLFTWNGKAWVTGQSKVTVILDSNGNMKFTSATKGSKSMAIVTDINLFSSLNPPTVPFNPLVGDNLATGGAIGLFNLHQTERTLQLFQIGSDGESGKPSYAELGVGTDGTADERRELIDSLRAQLGWPIVDVELTRYQWDQAVNNAIEQFRRRSALGYRRQWFFLDIIPGVQHYKLTNKTLGFNRIVNVNAVERILSSFLGTAEGQGVYGQVLLQHLFHMGTFDLTSFYLVNSYIEDLVKLFASDIQFYWNEDNRTLTLLQMFHQNERLLLDTMIERTEQELMRDRFAKNWIEQWARARAREMLAEIRGKYASLPGAGGGVSLNAAELLTKAETEMADCIQQVEDYIANNVEDVGMAAQFVIG